MKSKLENITYELSCLHTGVTGSAIILTIHLPNGACKQILIDCGIFQEYEFEKYNDSFPSQFHPENIDYVFLTHTHVDHCGRLPFLVKKGYSNHIYCTNNAKSLIIPALFDCAKILENDSKYLTKKRKTFIEPLYTTDDVKNTIKKTRGMNYNERYMLDENLSVTFIGNGHLMGAAVILIQISYTDCETINLMFSGDYNVKNLFEEVPDIPKWVKNLKLVIIQEATYGDSTTSDIKYTYDDTLVSLIQNNKTVISPVIACERAEQVLLKIKKLQDRNVISKRIPIYLAGSLACEYFKIYACKSTLDFIPENLTLVTSKDINIHSQMLEGKNLNFIDEIPDEILGTKGPKIILTTSGMADKGKAPYYLSKLVNREDVSVLFTCYLPSNTLGYTLKNIKHDTEFSFNVYGEKIKTKINCEILCSNEFSSHAKSDQLIDFLKLFPNIAGVFINHGNIKTKEIYAQEVIDKINPPFVNILDRSIFYSLSGYEILRISNSKYSSIEELENHSRKERKERKLKSKKSKPRFKNNSGFIRSKVILNYN